MGCGFQELSTVAINDYNVEVKLTMIDVTIDYLLFEHMYGVVTKDSPAVWGCQSTQPYHAKVNTQHTRG